jgi:hypothetical protein
MKYQKISQIPASQLRLYTEVMKQWGGASQFGMAIEELAELITALRHFDRGKCGIKKLAEELADVILMSEQIIAIFTDCPFISEPEGSYEDVVDCHNAMNFQDYLDAVFNEKLRRVESLITESKNTDSKVDADVHNYLKRIDDLIYEMTTYTDIEGEDSILLIDAIQYVRKKIKQRKVN